MKKTVFLLLVIAVLLGALPAASVTATSVADLTALARFFPAETPLFIVMRTDDAFIDTLEGVVERVASKLPSGTLPPALRLRNLLDMALQPASGRDFASGVRAWLGDSAAFGVMSAEDFNAPTGRFIIAASSTDPSAADRFFANVFERQNMPFERVPGDGFTILRPNALSLNEGGILIGQDVVLIATTDLAAVFGNPGTGNLSRSVVFNETLALLPESEYMALAYVDTAAITQASSPGMPMAEALGAQVFALTLLDERTLVLDIAANTGDLSALEAMGLQLGGVGPVDPNFAANIPANASLVFHSSNLKAYYDLVLQAARLGGTSAEELDQTISALKASVQSATGLDLDQDILSWLTGDFALFLRVDSAAILDAVEQSASGGQPVWEELPFGFGVVVEATDPAKASALATAVGSLLTRQIAASGDASVTAAQEQIGGVEATVLSSAIPMGSGEPLALDVVIGASDQVFVIASRSEAVAMLSGSARLDKAPAYQEASRYFLPDPSVVLYSDPNGLGGGVVIMGLTLLGPAIGNVFDNVLDNVYGVTPSPEEQERRRQERLRQEAENRRMFAIFRALTTAMSSSSLTSRALPGGDSVVRFAVTLAE